MSELRRVTRPGGVLAAAVWDHGAGMSMVVGVEDGALEVRRRYESFADYWEPFLLGTGPAGVYVTGLQDAARAALRAEVLADLGPGPFELTSRAWWVRGTAP